MFSKLITASIIKNGFNKQLGILFGIEDIQSHHKRFHILKSWVVVHPNYLITFVPTVERKKADQGNSCPVALIILSYSI